MAIFTNGPEKSKDKAFGLADGTFLGHNLGVNGSFILEKDLLTLVEGLFA